MGASRTSNDSKSGLRGFLLTRQWQETDTGLELIFWAATDHGPLRMVVPGQEAVCFISNRDRNTVRRLLAGRSGWRFGATRLRQFQQDPVLGLYFRSQRQLYDIRDQLPRQGVIVHEADINPTDRYLMERFITGEFELDGDFAQAGTFLDAAEPKLRPAFFQPDLKVVSVDIETDFKGEQLYSIGVCDDSIRRVFMVGDSTASETLDAGDFLSFYADEKSLLQAFLDWVLAYDPDVLIGWNVVNFDLRCLQQVCERVGQPFRLGRNLEEVRWRQARDGSERAFALVPGRVVLDGIELMRNATYQFENFSLDFVARELLNRGKLVDDVDQRGAEITHLFQTNKPALAEYNLEDCRLVWDIFAREHLVEFAIERSRLTGLELNRYGGSVAAFDFLYLPRLHRAGYVAPALGQNHTGNASPGGYVMNSIPGIHEHVIVLDFKSLYPSIIRTFHVDPLALLESEREADPIEGFDGGRFSRQQHLLPGLIENLWQARDRAKATGNRVLSQAIKIIMNSFYGVLGTTGCRFYDPRLVSSITRRGHQIIKESKDFIERAGFQVIYGDTDSVFVLIGGNDASLVDPIGRKLAADLNQWWTTRLRDEMHLDSCLEIEFETHFLKFLMPTVRGAETGSKKRYAGLVASEAEPGYRLVFKGLETVRSDWSPLARQFQQQLYEMIFLERPFEDFIKQTVEQLQSGHFETDLVLRRRLRRRLKDYVKNVPPHVQAARKAEALRAERGLPPLYERGGWVEYFMTVNGPEPRQYRHSAIDFDFYIERQIAPIADSILVFKSGSMKELLDRQIGLF